MIKTLGKLCLATLALTYSFSVQANATCQDHAVTPNPIPDTGLYWFKNNEDKVKASSNTNQSYFDPSKPTMIYIHGWQSGAIAKGTYERFDYQNHDCVNGFSDDLVEAWKIASSDGQSWNVGAFYWREHADETLPNLAEAKIWNANRFASNKTVAEMFVEEYKSAMNGYGNQEIRLVGHSFGSQVVLAAGEKIMNDSALSSNQKPKRVALLDPAFTNVYVKNVTTSGTLAVRAARSLKDRGVALEYYRVSEANLGSQALGVTFDGTAVYQLRQMSAFAEIRPWYIEGVAPFNAGDKHIAAPYLYLQSNKYAAPKEVTIGGWEGAWQGYWIFRRWNPYAWWNPVKRVPTGASALSASTPTYLVKTHTGANHYWDQVSGRNEADTKDDQFVKKRRW